MDYLLVSLSAALLPYVLGLSHVDFKSRVGTYMSMIDQNKYEITLLQDPAEKSVEQVLLSSKLNTQFYGIRPDFFIDYGITLNRFWLAPTFGWDPIRSKLIFSSSIKSVGSNRSSKAPETEMDYDKGPYMGLKFGYQILKPKTFGSQWDAFGLTPYVLAGFHRVYYETNISTLSGSHNMIYRYYVGAGAKVDFKGSWASYFQYRTLSFDTLSSSLENEQISVKEQEMQFGISYWFGKKPLYAQRLGSKKKYDYIINRFDIYINKKNKKSDKSKPALPNNKVQNNRMKSQSKAINNKGKELVKSQNSSSANVPTIPKSSNAVNK